MRAILPARAFLLGVADDQGVVLLEMRDIGFEGFHKQLAQRFVGFAAVNQAEFQQQAAGVGVDHEDQSLKGIEQDIVRRFRAYAVYAQKARP